ncbi:MAG: hypothetical protein J0H46_09555 [Bacteroidetes bacterium]|nr:hypothetical protein [Bacteroidota bacterium]
MQCYTVADGKTLFGRDGTPFVLFFLSLCFPIWFLKSCKSPGKEPKSAINKTWGFIAGVAGIGILVPSLSKMFSEFPDPGSYSDVIPQLDFMFTRFQQGLQPYEALPQLGWHPYPVYMTMHWLPLGIGYALHIDIRWVRILLLALASGLWGRIILCLLSRYTMIFWLPLFAILLWMNKPPKVSVAVWASTAIAVILLYVVPFLAKDPQTLTKGIAYHNHCAIAEWDLFDKKAGNFGTFAGGIYFAPYEWKLIPGDAEHKVFVSRSIQAVLMIGVVAWGLWYYRKNKKRFNFYDMSLAGLYLTVLFFYMFSPLLYKYYYIVLLCMSAVLTGKILMNNNQQKPGKNEINTP